MKRTGYYFLNYKRDNLDWEIMEGLQGIKFTRQKVVKVHYKKT